MVLIVQKYGGILVGIIDCIKSVVKWVEWICDEGYDVVVVLFVMSGEINCLLVFVYDICVKFFVWELDVLVIIGEQVIIVLLSMVLQSDGYEVCFYIGVQVRIFIDDLFGKVCIQGIDVECIGIDFFKGCIVVVVGFQGVDGEGNIMMLGCGGFDMFVVVLVVAFKVDECQIYMDVDGVYIIDFWVVGSVCRLDCIIFEEMLEMVSQGLKVLQICLVEFVGKYNVLLWVLFSFEDGFGILIIVDEEEFMEQFVILGIVFNCDEVKIIVCGVLDILGVVYKILGFVGYVNIEVDMIV